MLLLQIDRTSTVIYICLLIFSLATKNKHAVNNRNDRPCTRTSAYDKS